MIELRQALFRPSIEDILHAAAGRCAAAAESGRIRDGFRESVGRDECQPVRPPFLEPQSAAIVIRKALARLEEDVAEGHDDALLPGVGHETPKLIPAAGADVVGNGQIVGQVRNGCAEAERLGRVALLLALQAGALGSYVGDLDHHAPW